MDKIVQLKWLNYYFIVSQLTTKYFVRHSWKFLKNAFMPNLENEGLPIIFLRSTNPLYPVQRVIAEDVLSV